MMAEHPEGAGDSEYRATREEVETKLELARDYKEMEDEEGAREMLQEVLAEGDDDQIETAREMLRQLGDG